MGAYLYTDRNGELLETGDIIKSFHSQFSEKSFIVGTLQGRAPVDACPCGEDHLIIEVLWDETHHIKDGEESVHTSYTTAGTKVFPACVEKELGGAFVELLSKA